MRHSGIVRSDGRRSFETFFEGEGRSGSLRGLGRAEIGMHVSGTCLAEKGVSLLSGIYLCFMGALNFTGMRSITCDWLCCICFLISIRCQPTWNLIRDIRVD